MVRVAAGAVVVALLTLTGTGGAAAQPTTPTAPVSPTPTPTAPTTTPPTRWVEPPPTTTPAPTTPTSPTPGENSSPRSGPSAAECGVTNISGCVELAIDGFFQRVIDTSLDPLLDLLSQTLLTTPEPGDIPQIGVLWTQSWELMLALYVLVVMAAGVLLMVRETLQTQWSIRELAPRLVVGFIAGAMSMVIATTAIGFANAMAAAVGEGGVGDSAAAGLAEITSAGPASQSFGLLLMLVLVVMLVVLVITYVVRVAITILLIVAAPLALMCHGLPGIDGIARWWWRSFAACLAIQVVQSMTLVVALRVFLSPGGWEVFGPNANGIVSLIVGLALVAVLVKAPFWLLSVMGIGQGRSFVGSIARAYLTFKTLGLLKGASAGSGAGGRAATAARPRPPRASQGGRRTATVSPPNPYARVRATRSGQLMLPLQGVHRVPRQPTPSPAASANTKPSRTPRGRQLAFNFNPPDPYQGIRPGKNGQYPLPIPVRRVKPTPPPQPARPPAPPPAARTRARQLSFDFSEPTPTPAPVAPPADPYAGNRATRSGQYPLPIPVRRVKPAPPPATPPEPAPAARRSTGRQLHLPMPDLPVRRRAHRAPRGGKLR
ncbi:hypothetical protein ACFVVM_16850 [Nocardia sp. NPDC058176]|uniref:hypothetical protein n=1 Tax=Nocardia sp. NPDC058176 TaxID=3346368 RepID=UPI0036DD44E6